MFFFIIIFVSRDVNININTLISFNVNNNMKKRKRKRKRSKRWIDESSLCGYIMCIVSFIIRNYAIINRILWKDKMLLKWILFINFIVKIKFIGVRSLTSTS